MANAHGVAPIPLAAMRSGLHWYPNATDWNLNMNTPTDTASLEGKSVLDTHFHMNGLPANLLCAPTDNKPLPLYALIGLHNREERKHIARKLRKALRASKGVSDEELITATFKAQSQRLSVFWESKKNFSVRMSEGDVAYDLYGPSIPHSLISLYDGGAFADAISLELEGELKEMGVPWDDIVANLQEKFPDEFNPINLGFLRIWKQVIAELEHWEMLDTERQSLIANAIFALSSATDSEYFLFIATSVCRDLVVEYDGLVNARSTDAVMTDLAATLVDPTEPHAPISVTATAENWSDLVGELNTLAGRMAQDGPSQELVDAIRALANRFDLVDLPSPISISSVLEKLHALFDRYESGEDAELFAPVLADLRQILARWRLLSYQADAHALADLYADLDQRAVAAAPFEAQYLETARALSTAIAACEEAQRRVASAPLARKAELRAELKSRERQRNETDDQLTQSMVDLFSALNFKGQEFDTTRDWTQEFEDAIGHDEPAPQSFLANPSRQDTGTNPSTDADIHSAASSAPMGMPATTVELASPELTIATHTPSMESDLGESPNAGVEAQTELGSALKPETELEPNELEPLKPTADFAPEAAAREEKRRNTGESLSEYSPIFDRFWGLIAAGEYGLAYNLSLAADPTFGVPSPNVVRLLVLGTELVYPQGAIAKSLEDTAIAFNSDIDLGTVSGTDNAAANLLLVAGTIRSGLLAPGTGANDILQRDRTLGNGWDNLHKLIQSVAQSAHQMHGVVLGPDAFRQHKADKTLEATREAIKVDAESWLEGNSKSRLTFQPATQIWHQWVGREGRIYKLLMPLIDSSASMSSEWRDILSEMANPALVESRIQESDRAIRGNRFGNIDYKALGQLQRRVGEAVAMVRRWISIKDFQPKSDFVDRAIKSLDQCLEQLKPAVYAEVESAQLPDRGTAATRAAASCLHRELNRLYALFATAPAVGSEERPELLALNADLLFLPGMHLDASRQPEAAREAILQAILAYQPGCADVATAVVTKMDEGDFVAAQLLIEWSYRMVNSDYDHLVETFDFRLNEARDALRAQHAQTMRLLENGFRAGLVADADRDQKVSVLNDIETRIKDILRIDLARLALDSIDTGVGASTAARMNEIKERFTALELPAEDPRHEAIVRLLEKGDALAAEEYIDHVGRGETPPSSEQAEEELSTFPNFLSQAPARTNLGEAEVALRCAQDWQGLAFSSLSEPARQDAAGLLAAWNAIKRHERRGGEPTFDSDAVARLMTAIGFKVVNSGGVTLTSKAISRMEMVLRTQPLSDRRVCPAPEFGSEARGNYRVICIYPKTQELEATEVAPPQRAVTAATIVLFMGQLSREGRQKLLRQNLHARRSYIVVDEAIILYLAMHAQGRLRAMFSATLPYTVTDPYRIKQAGIVPPEMFFGRSSEREAIISPHGAASVYGGRQLGKTVLLKEIERLLHDPASHSIVQWVDLPGHNVGRSCRPEALWTIVVRELYRYGIVAMDWPEFRETEPKHVARVIEDIRKWLNTNSEGRILLLLDEADEFLKEEAAEDYPVTRQLKALMERTGGRFKTVFVGLHNVLRSTRAANNPLVHLNAVEIGPLYAHGESRAAFEMVRQPFAALGYVFADDSLIMRILAACNYYPNLINLFCRKLLEKLRNRADAAAIDPSRSAYMITEKVVSETYEQTALREEIRHYFLLTLELDARYELIANWMAMEYLQKRMNSSEGLQAISIRTAALALWPEGFRATSDNEFDALLMEMVGLGVLRRTNDNNFTFRNPNVLQLMGTAAEIDERLTKIAVDGEIKPGFDETTFRGPLTANVRDPNRSPLSIAQEHEIAYQENGVAIICGAPLSGLIDVQEALRHRHLISQLVSTAALSVDMAEKDLDALRAKPKHGVNILRVANTTPWNVEWLSRFHSSLKARQSSSSFVRAIFEAGPALLWSMAKEDTLNRLDDHNVLVLKPWVDQYLWIWLEDINLPPQKTLRQAILNATDGRPGLMMQLHSELDAGPRINERVEAFNKALSTPERASVVLAGLGVLSEHARKGLIVFKDFPGETLMDIDRIWTEMGPTCVRLSSFVRWAELLCLVRPVGADRWELEPFVARLLDAVNE